LIVEGPMVTDMRANFAEDWNHFANKNKYVGRNRRIAPIPQSVIDAIEAQRAAERASGLRGADHYSRWLKDPEQRMNGIGRYIAQKPYKDINTITEAYLQYLDGVSNYLGITNPVPWDTRTEAPATRGLRPHYLSFNNFNRLHDKVQELMRDRKGVRVDYITSGGDFAANEAVPMTVDRIAGYVERGAYVRANANQVWLDKTTPFLNKLKKPFENLLKDYVVRAKKPGTTVTSEEAYFDNVAVWVHLAFIHQKIFYFDRLAASIGSLNFLQNATDHAYEATAIIQDAALNREIDHAMVLDMANSFPFTFKNIER
ncbi:MAG TPA: phospholipase D-like domain-containing protein, partial [Bdellovibrionales bacterium]|nr:phospholipase D-like domain-containing protein [Bdellovibrionales bacterium]